MDTQGIKIPQKTVGIMVLGFMILIGSGLGTFFSVSPKIKRVDAQIAAASHRLAVMKDLSPSYTRLLKMYQEQSEIETIPYDPAKALAEHDISSFGQMVDRLASDSGMIFVAATPSPESLKGEDRTIMVDLAVRGTFENFRGFLIKILQVPSLAYVQGVQIRTIPEDKEYTLQLWVRLQ